MHQHAPSTPPSSPQPLRDARERFIALWGQMGSNWGIPRTMALVHAVLFISDRPLNTDDVIDTLAISRGNASMSLRALVDWGIVYRVHKRGHRKEYYQAEQDVWKLFRTILAQRKKREIDPLLEALEECRRATDIGGKRRVDPEAAAVQAHNERLDDLLHFMRMVDSISSRFISPSGQGLEMAAKLLDHAS